MAQFGQLAPSLGKAQFRLVAQGEQRFGAAGGGAGAGHFQHLVRRHVGALTGARAREGAVVAQVAAQLGQRQEDLGRPGLIYAERAVAHGCGTRQQSGQRCIDQRMRLGGGQGGRIRNHSRVFCQPLQGPGKSRAMALIVPIKIALQCSIVKCIIQMI